MYPSQRPLNVYLQEKLALKRLTLRRIAQKLPFDATIPPHWVPLLVMRATSSTTTISIPTDTISWNVYKATKPSQLQLMKAPLIVYQFQL